MKKAYVVRLSFQNLMRGESEVDVLPARGISFERKDDLLPIGHRPTAMIDMPSGEVLLGPSPEPIPEHVKKRRIGVLDEW
jgi:hypothetical protein